MTVRIPGDDAADHHPLAVERLVLEIARVGVHVATDLLRDLAHRVLREVQAEQLLLPAQPLAHRDLRGGRQGPLEGVRVGRAEVEERCLAGDPIALGRLRRRDGVVDPEQQLGRVSERPHGPDLDEGLEHLPVRQPQVDAGAQVGQRAERPALGARRDDRFDRPLADVLDREEPEPDGVTLDGELEVARVDVRWQHLDGHPATLRDGRRDLLLARPERGQHRGHVVDRVVRLEVRGLVGDQPVTGGVRLVEAVALERLERVEDGIDDPGVDAPLGRLGDEALLLGAQDRRLLLADRVARACPPRGR